MFALQRELHTQQGQRLLAVVHVKSVKAGKLNRRANKSLLCLTVKDDVCTLQKVRALGIDLDHLCGGVGHLRHQSVQ